jgi:polyphosphate glucokinase
VYKDHADEIHAQPQALHFMHEQNKGAKTVNILGIDIGGSGIKGAPVDTTRGELIQDRFRIETPQPSAPEAVAEVVAEIARHFEWQGPIGCTFPAIVRHGVIHSAANVDQGWVGVNGVEMFQKTTGCPVRLLNDADAAGMAEMKFGAGKDRKIEKPSDVVIVLTFGTGIGSAIFVNGHLLPNSELGHLILRGQQAEHYAAARIRKEEDLSWKKWGKRVNEYLHLVEFYFSPDLFIIGGGVSKKFDKFAGLLDVEVECVPAQLRNDAGIVGAAIAAAALETA